nr:helix-turn-helix transcriptional regulator [Burkholderia sp. Ac-20365]
MGNGGATIKPQPEAAANLLPQRPAVDYSVKTLSQLRPVLRGFRKAAGLTQAMLAERLGITQQSYAQFEADPAAAGVERLFTVLRLLNAGITLSQNEPWPANTAPVAKMASSNGPHTQGRRTTKTAPRKRATHAASAPALPTAVPTAVPALKAGKRSPAGAAITGARKTVRKPAAAAKPARPASQQKKREPW